MQYRRLTALGSIAALSLLFSTAHAVPVSYEVHSNYTAPNYSASWLHEATGCNSLNAGLYMCGTKSRIESGTLSGDLNSGILSNVTGELRTATQTIRVTAGVLGGAFAWYLTTDLYGTFEFLDLSALPGSPYNASNQPNSFNTSNDPNDLVLWGQNFAAPGLSSASTPFVNGVARRGIDLYAQRIPVLEPGTVLLLVVGVVGLVLVRRKQQATLTR